MFLKLSVNKKAAFKPQRYGNMNLNTNSKNYFTAKHLTLSYAKAAGGLFPAALPVQDNEIGKIIFSVSGFYLAVFISNNAIFEVLNSETKVV